MNLDALFMHFSFGNCWPSSSARYVRKFSVFNVCSACNNCSSAGCGLAANVVCRDV
jgi:hypothetical protein